MKVNIGFYDKSHYNIYAEVNREMCQGWGVRAIFSVNIILVKDKLMADKS